MDFSLTLLKSLGLNIALLLSLLAIYRLTLSRWTPSHSGRQALVRGLAFGVIGIIGMMMPMQVAPGVFIDGHVVIAALAGAFNGWWAAFFAGGLIVIYRLYLGGVGTFSDMGAILTAVMIGTGFYYFFRDRLTALHLLGLGILLAISGLVWTGALPDPMRMYALHKYWLPVSIVYPLSAVFLGILLVYETQQRQLEDTVRTNEKRLADQVAQQAALLGVSQAVLRVTQPEDLKQVAQTCLHVLQKMTVTVEALAIHRMRDPELGQMDSLRIMSDKVITDLVPHTAEPEFVDLWRQNKPRCRNNLPVVHPKDFDTLMQRFDGLQIMSHIDVPFAQGILCIHSTHVSAFSEDDVDFLKKIAEILSVGLARVEDLERLANRSVALENEIAERIRVEQELVRTQRLRAVGELSAGVSHNLNNILTGVLGPAMLLQYMVTDPDAQHEIEQIIYAGQRARDLVHRLHLSTRNTQKQSPQGVDVNGIVEEAVRLTQPRWKDEKEAEGIAIKITTDLQPTALVSCLPAEVLDMVVNFLFNAVDALPEGGDIKIATQMVGEEVELCVADTGVGMDEDTKRRIFEPFFTTKVTVGTGLGLATVYNTVKRWQGTIDVQSALGQGAVFRVRLPVMPSDNTVV